MKWARKNNFNTQLSDNGAKEIRLTKIRSMVEYVNVKTGER